MNIAIIPARGGSKRVKNKNIKLFKGKPMIYWTIKAAKDSKLFSTIFVDTDSNKIKKISIKYGAKVPFLRSSKLAKDNVSVNFSTYHFILNLKKLYIKKKIKFNVKTITQLMPNCPFREGIDIKKLFAIFKKRKTKFLISHFQLIFGNIWWSVILKNKKVFKLFKNTYSKRSQDLKKTFCPTGAIWIADYRAFLKSKTFYGKDYTVGILDWKKGIDIDNKEELKISEKLI